MKRKPKPKDLDGEILRAGSALVHRVPGRFRHLPTAGLQAHLEDADAMLKNGVIKVLAFEHLQLVVMTSETAARLTHSWVNRGKR